jgi:predicted O-linked N-acetylglucosamine transferase (SPINDLY family)
VVFCCFNQTYKFTPDVFAVWMRLLGRVPDSVLWLAAGNELANANLRREARRQGVDETRLIFAPRMPYAEHLARYHAATLALDTFPYTSHTTQSDALWAGCPAVGFFDERISDTFAARVSCGILNAAGLPELICHTLEEYEALALRLASDGAALAAVRGKIAQARDHSPLFDTRRFTRNLEALFEHMAVHSP